MIFGGIICAAGFVGVTLGSATAQHYRKVDMRADPFVCAAGVFVAVPLTFFGLLLANSGTLFSWILLFFAITALSTNWAVVSDMLLSVTLPNKRAFATSIQILLSHAFGDAASPFIIGFLRDELKPALNDDLRAFQYALMTTLIILTLGAVAFVHSARYYARDVEDCRKALNSNGDTSIEVASNELQHSNTANLTNFVA